MVILVQSYEQELTNDIPAEVMVLPRAGPWHLSKVLLHAASFPYQFAWTVERESDSDYKVQIGLSKLKGGRLLRQSSIIVAGTDGLFDNLSPETIADVVRGGWTSDLAYVGEQILQKARAASSTPRSFPGKQSEAKRSKAKQSEAKRSKAKQSEAKRSKSKRGSSRGTFQRRAFLQVIRQGYGGKPEAITIAILRVNI